MSVETSYLHYGPATLLVDDVEHAVHAQVAYQSPPSEDHPEGAWTGIVHAAADLPDGPLRLRLPDGRERVLHRVVVTRRPEEGDTLVTFAAPQVYHEDYSGGLGTV